MIRELHADLETYSEVPIEHGTHRYAEGAEIMLFLYAFDDGPVQCWDVTTGAPMPRELLAALRDESVTIVGWNFGNFDSVIMQHCGIPVDRSRIHDCMVQALSHGLPGALDKNCEVFKLSEEEAKIKDGKRLIQLFCKPRPKNQKLRRATRETHPEEWQRFIDYGKSDIVSARILYRRMPRWNYPNNLSEHALWVLDQKINNRGVLVDQQLALAAIEAAAKAKTDLDDAVNLATLFEVESTRKTAKLLAYLRETCDLDIANLKGGTLEKLLELPELDEHVRELLVNRLQASSTSVAKYKRLLRAVSHDGRLRGLMQFAGAARTARWAGRVFQPQNLTRIPKWMKKIYDNVVELVKSGNVELLFDNVMEVLSVIVRACIVAPPGRKLVIADLSNIEGRVLAWLAGEAWKLTAFAEGRDLYVEGYSRSFGVTQQEVVDDDNAGGVMRLIGKVQELACGYQGAVGAFQSMALIYNLDIEDEVALPLVKAWRKANPNIVSFWYELERMVKASVREPGRLFTCRRLVIRTDGAWTKVRLPSGRLLCYLDVQLDDADKLSYLGVHPYTKRWCRIATYGGKLVENVTQAVARDVLAENMPVAERHFYEIVLSVHDELITETDDTDEFSATELAEIMSIVPRWAEGLPLAAAGYTTRRYRKD